MSVFVPYFGGDLELQQYFQIERDPLHFDQHNCTSHECGSKNNTAYILEQSKMLGLLKHHPQIK